VVVADDHPVYRDGLATLLGSVPGLVVVGTAADGVEAVRLAREEQPDVVVMDVQMPRLDGIEATRQVTAESPSVGVVVLTMSEDDGTVFSAVRAGARDYLLKGADQEEVVRAITTVAAGGAVFGASLARRIAEFFAAAPAGPAASARVGCARCGGATTWSSWLPPSGGRCLLCLDGGHWRSAPDLHAVDAAPLRFDDLDHESVELERFACRRDAAHPCQYITPDRFESFRLDLDVQALAHLVEVDLATEYEGALPLVDHRL